MTAYPNGSATVPQKGDVLVFNGMWGDPYGHVALVRSVSGGVIDFVQQNMFDIGEDTLPIDSHNQIDSLGRYGPVRGWLRDTSSNDTQAAAAPTPTTEAPAPALAKPTPSEQAMQDAVPAIRTSAAGSSITGFRQGDGQDWNESLFNGKVGRTAVYSPLEQISS